MDDIEALAAEFEQHRARLRAVATRATNFANPDAEVIPAPVNGGTGTVVLVHGLTFAVMSFTIRGGRIAEIAVLADPDRLERLDLAAIRG